MEFRILGSFEVFDNGARVAVRGRHHPKVLALLLCRAGQVVSMNQLIDTLWNDSLPDTAPRQVQNIVAGLRRQLGESGPRIERVGTGYRLDLSGATLDAQRFVQEVERANELRDAGNLADAYRRLESALRHWRGPALSGLDFPSTSPLVDRLNQTRLAAVETRVDLALSLGDSELGVSELGESDLVDLIAELREMSAAYPYHERLAIRLMKALHRHGCGAEALKVYIDLRDRLADELGIDPGQAITTLYTELLSDDAEDLPPSDGGYLLARAQLPAAVGTFTGRSFEVAALDAMLPDDGPRLTAVTGTGGSGKTTLVVSWAHRRRDLFPDGQLYVDLRGFDVEPMLPHTVLSQFLQALGLSPDQVPSRTTEAAALYRSMLADRRVMVILDNAGSVDQIRPLLPGGADNRTVVTSRNRLAGLIAVDDAAPVTLNGLNRADSVELVVSLLGADRIRSDEAEQLAELCGDLPLALRIAAANLAMAPDLAVAQYIHDLQSGDRLEQLSIDGDPKATVPAVFEASFQTVPPAEQRMFAILGLIPGAFCRDMAAKVSGHDLRTAYSLLHRLESAHLLEPRAGGLYGFHDLVHFYARHRAEVDLTPEVRDEARDQAIEWIHERRGRLGTAALDPVLSICRQFADRPAVWKAVEAFAGCINLGYGLDSIREVVDSLPASSWSRQGQAAILRVTAGCRWADGELDEAVGLARRAVELTSGLADPAARAAAGNDLARYLLQCGDVAGAKSEVLAFLRGVDRERDPKAWATAMVRLASVHRCEGDVATAESTARAAMEHSGDFDDVYGDAWCDLLLLYRDTARYDDAIESCGGLVERAEAMSSPRLEAAARGIRAEALLASGRPREALAEAEKALEALRIFWCSGQIHEVSLVKATALAAVGDVDEALALVTGADRFFSGREAHRFARAEIELARGRVLMAAGRYVDAIGSAGQAASMFEAMPYPARQAAALAVAVESCEGSGDTTRVSGLRRSAERILSGLETAG